MSDSKACRELPVAITEHYEPKGSWVDIDGLKTYTHGPEKEANKGVLCIYDIFGYTSQIYQGADVFAAAGYQVAMPDFFLGKPASPEWLPPDTDDKKAKMAHFRAESADIPKSLARIPSVMAALRRQYPAVRDWCAIGYCWGGKLIALASAGADTPFKAAVQTSPGRLDVADAREITIPMALLASKDEPADQVQGYREALKGRQHVEIFETMIHGWMSARANLTDPEVRKEYERGYRVALQFFDEVDG